MKFFYIFILFFLSYINLFSQIDENLLIELDKELNPTIIGWVDKPKDCLRDTTKKLMPNPLPNHKKIIKILNTICSSNDTNYIAPLKAIYLNYIPKFSQIWGYKFQTCEIAWKEQYQILATFEGTLRSLILLTYPDRNEKVINEFNLHFLILNTKNWDTLNLLYDKYPLISEEFRTLKRRNEWFLDFNYYDRYTPYHEIINKEVMNDLYTFQPGNRDISNQVKWSIVTNNKEIVRNNKSEEKIKFLSKNMKKWVDNGYSSFLVEFVGDQLNHPEILPKLWKKALLSDSLTVFSKMYDRDFKLFRLNDLIAHNADQKILSDILYEYVRPMKTSEQILAITYFNNIDSKFILDNINKLVDYSDLSINNDALQNLQNIVEYNLNVNNRNNDWKTLKKKIIKLNKKIKQKKPIN